jgi:DNA-binding LacI/PurR family transcriptional regulator
MHERGIERKIRVYQIPQDPIASYQVGEEIFANLNAVDRPTAIFAASDTFAIYLMQAAYQAGISIPDQISIVGFDNIDITPYTIPPLTTISQSGIQMGQNAANLMLDMIEQNRDSSEVDDVIMEPTLIVRQSTSVPPGQ